MQTTKKFYYQLRLVLFSFFFSWILHGNISYCDDNIISNWSTFYPAFFCIAVSSELIFPGSSIVILPLVVLVLDSSPSSDVNAINYETLLTKEELRLQVQLETGNNVSDTFAKLHNVLIITIDLFGIYFLPAYASMFLLPTAYMLEYCFFWYFNNLPNFYKLWGLFTVDFSFAFSGAESAKNVTNISVPIVKKSSTILCQRMKG